MFHEHQPKGHAGCDKHIFEIDFSFGAKCWVVFSLKYELAVKSMARQIV